MLGCWTGDVESDTDDQPKRAAASRSIISVQGALGFGFAKALLWTAEGVVMNAEAPALRFVYQDANGLTSVFILSRWREDGHYLRGLAGVERQYRTFRKDRVERYLDGAESLLTEPYSPPPPKPQRDAVRDDRPQVLFTGFSASTRATLEAKADVGGLCVVKTVTQRLAFLCAGPNAGPTKREKAMAQGVYVMNETDLLVLLETGELPDSVVADVQHREANDD